MRKYVRKSIRVNCLPTSTYLGPTSDPSIALYERSKVNYRALAISERDRALVQLAKYTNVASLLRLAFWALQLAYEKMIEELKVQPAAEITMASTNLGPLPQALHVAPSAEHEAIRAEFQELMYGVSIGDPLAAEKLVVLAEKNPGMLDCDLDFLELARDALNRLVKEQEFPVGPPAVEKLLEQLRLEINKNIHELSSQVKDPFERLLHRHMAFHGTLAEYNGLQALLSKNQPASVRRVQVKNLAESEKYLRFSTEMLMSYRKAKRRSRITTT